MKQRERKLRAWDGEQMHYPADGQYVAIFSGPRQVAWRLYDRNGTAICDSQYGGVLTEFTGLHDNNGKEIYEGDVIRAYDRKGSVVYDDMRACYIMHDLWNEALYNVAYACEVIGNLYEHTEMLK